MTYNRNTFALSLSMSHQKFIRVLRRTKRAGRETAQASSQKKNTVLRTLAVLLGRHCQTILAANRRDLAGVPKNYPHRDRLLLTQERIRGMIAGLRQIERLPDPVGAVIDRRIRPNGLRIRRERVPFGVVGIIYESRPNVTVEIFSIAVKTGNAVVLKGGEEAWNSNRALVSLIHRALRLNGLPPEAALMLDPGKPKIVEWLLEAHGLVDVLIPRGGMGLIRFVREYAKVPIIETGAGVCHMYVEKTADLRIASRLIANAKTRRPSVCNALDTIVVDRALLSHLPAMVRLLEKERVRIYADRDAQKALKGTYAPALLRKAKTSDFGKEFLSLQCSIKTVSGFDEALRFVADHTSGHSEGIVTRDKTKARRFLSAIDAAALYVNASIAFTDGNEFGLGAEVGISTQKLHARGPMGLEELTSYKWIVEGTGQIRGRQ